MELTAKQIRKKIIELSKVVQLLDIEIEDLELIDNILIARITTYNNRETNAVTYMIVKEPFEEDTIHNIVVDLAHSHIDYLLKKTK